MPICRDRVSIDIPYSHSMTIRQLGAGDSLKCKSVADILVVRWQGNIGLLSPACFFVASDAKCIVIERKYQGAKIS